MSAQPSLLPGQSAPLFTITPTNQSGVLIIATALGLTFGVISLLIRAYVRFEFSRSYGLDDVLIAIAFIFSIFQSSTVFVAIEKGLGKTLSHVDPTELGPIQKAAYSSDILYIVTLYLTKCSIAFLFLRLSPDKRHELVSKSLLFAAIVTGIVSVFIVSLRCDLSHPWIFINGHCTGVLDRWRVVAAFDITTEVALVAIAVYIIHGLQMSLSKKLAVILAFGFRIIIVAPSILRLHYISTYLASSDPTLDAEYATVWTQVELSYAIIAATIPCLRPFMTATHTTWGGEGNTRQDSRYVKESGRSGQISSGKKSPLVSLTAISSRLSRKSEKKDSQRDITLSTKTSNGWEDTDARKVVGGGVSTSNGDQRSVASDESKQMMIRRDVEWTVEYEAQSATGPE